MGNVFFFFFTFILLAPHLCRLELNYRGKWSFCSCVLLSHHCPCDCICYQGTFSIKVGVNIWSHLRRRETILENVYNKLLILDLTQLHQSALASHYTLDFYGMFFFLFMVWKSTWYSFSFSIMVWKYWTDSSLIDHHCCVTEFPCE